MNVGFFAKETVKVYFSVKTSWGLRWKISCLKKNYYATTFASKNISSFYHFICNFIWNFYTFLFTYIFCLVIFKATIMSGIDELYRHLPRLSLISDVFFLEQRGLMNIKQKIPELILFKLFSLANARNWTFILKAKITYLIESEGLVSFTIQKVKFKNYSFIL